MLHVLGDDHDAAVLRLRRPPRAWSARVVQKSGARSRTAACVQAAPRAQGVDHLPPAPTNGLDVVQRCKRDPTLPYPTLPYPTLPYLTLTHHA